MAGNIIGRANSRREIIVNCYAGRTIKGSEWGFEIAVEKQKNRPDQVLGPADLLCHVTACSNCWLIFIISATIMVIVFDCFK